jgi:beta-N-acetylhexosaminidase
MTKAFITGCAGLELTADERTFLTDEDPWGLILFRRNCESAVQISALTASFREAVGRADAPVLIDQEGGRVQRLRPPLAPSYPPARRFGQLYELDREKGMRAAFLGARLIAHDLAALGITVDCMPVLDVLFPQTVDAIGDRAYADEPEAVAALARAACDGLLAGGVLPVIKHLPGHGRAEVDSHLELPRVRAPRSDLEALDMLPFRKLADLPLGMTCHLLFEDIDPDHPATQSKIIIEQVIRRQIGFDGVLMSDDLSMEALGGGIGSRAAKSFAAGCDLALHCNGDMAEMRQVAEVAPELEGVSLARCDRALASRRVPQAGFDALAARAEMDALLAGAELA